MEILFGPDIWRVQQPNHPLIQGVLWEGDVMMLLGTEKAGKSILGLQMAFCLTTGTPFLDKYTIPHPVPVLYIQTEGKENEMVEERMRHMANTIDLEETRFARLFYHFLPLDSHATILRLLDAIKQLPEPPRVIFVDSLYTSMMGDLNENQPVRQFITTVSHLMRELSTSLVLIHHETKEQWMEGRLVDRGDRASYGSVFLRAWVSHILYLKKHKDKSRTLSCDTQRSGKVLEQEELILIEPDPLCFQIKGDYAPYIELTLHHLSKAQGLTRGELQERTGLSMGALEKGLRQLLLTNKVTKSVGYPRTYHVRKV